MKYQPFNDLPASQYEALRRDIEVRGVILPILLDENGRTIDGHQRRRAAAELGIECPSVQVEGLTEDEKIGLAFTLNLFRRHLSGTERAMAIGELARRGLSTRRMSDLLGLSKSAIHRDIQAMEATGEVERPDTVTSRNGRDMPSHKPPRAVPPRDTSPPAGVDLETGEVLEGDAREAPEVADDEAAPSTDRGAGVAATGDGADSEGHGASSAPDAGVKAPAPDPARALRDAWHSEIARATGRLITLEPSELAAVLSLDDAGSAIASVKAIRAWCVRVEASLSKPNLKAV